MILVTRTVQAITIVNLSFYESETVIRVFNDIFLLMSHKELEEFFRNPKTGQVKEVFAFVVDEWAVRSISKFASADAVK